MNQDIRNLQPALVWEIFDDITAVPRPSKSEEKICAWLIDFARQHSLDYRTDKAGNITIFAPATAGMEDRPTVVLQSHMDMVCEKNADTAHDFANDPIQTYIDGDWVKARGTTLGADCGIGMAAALAVLIDPTLTHGPIEALFTVDEETGLTGAFNLGKDMISGEILINLDSEDEGELFIGCAGGIDTVASLPYSTESAPEGYTFFRVDVTGLKGGHSGDNINDGLGNSNRILARLLWSAERKLALRVARFDGGNLRNAIPREAWAVVAVPEAEADNFAAMFEKFHADVKAEYALTDEGLKMTLSTAEAAEVVSADTTRRMLNAVVGVPNGVLAMSASMPGLVETSTNLASVKFTDTDIIITTSQRSSVESAKYAAAQAVESVFELAGAKVAHSDGYPGWAPNLSSHILSVTSETYERLFDTKAKIKAIHAGLECGLFLEKYPALDMVSFGPTLRGVHSPDERLDIPSVDKFWQLLREVLANI